MSCEREKASWRHGCNRVTRGVEITSTMGRGKGKLPSTGDVLQNSS